MCATDSLICCLPAGTWSIEVRFYACNTSWQAALKPRCEAWHASVQGTDLTHDCSSKAELRTANYSLFALFGLAALNEVAMTSIGLRGVSAP
jgi:hypothetical protein